MGEPSDKASTMYGPQGGGTFPTGSAYDRLAGTTGEDSTPAKLTVGRMATILVGAQAVRFNLRGTLGTATAVATTDPIIPAYGRFDWAVQPDTSVVYVESADATTAYEAWVFHSSS
jgi:hypothetical protein